MIFKILSNQKLFQNFFKIVALANDVGLQNVMEVDVVEFLQPYGNLLNEELMQMRNYHDSVMH